MNHGLVLDQVQIARRHGEASIGGGKRLGVAPQPKQALREAPRDGRGAGVERPRPLEVLSRGIPPAQALLDERGGGEQVRVVRRDLEPFLIRRES